jgi:hypothetical protein
LPWLLDLECAKCAKNVQNVRISENISGCEVCLLGSILNTGSIARVAIVSAGPCGIRKYDWYDG